MIYFLFLVQTIQMKLALIFITLSFLIVACNQNKTNDISQASQAVATELLDTTKIFETPKFSLKEANRLLELPLHCVETAYPNKLGQTLGGEEDLQTPTMLHPIFYGCFDWHSAVHGYWSMATLLKQFPEMEKADEAWAILECNITPDNVATELAYFSKKINTSYERTYGWAWLLKLQEVLYTWNTPKAQQLAKNLQPLSAKIVSNYKDFLPKLTYPIRVGEHSNTAFGFTFAYDYAVAVKDTALSALIEKRAKDFYLNDAGCPITWEPSGYDFLSPCLEEIDIMRRVLSASEFRSWMSRFMPQLTAATYRLEVGEVGDRTDGKLVHLDGLNFSRAWVLYGLSTQYPEYAHLKNTANQHISHSYPNLVGDSYEGGHWLGSFALYALTQTQ